MKTRVINGAYFGGQFRVALEKLEKGEVVDLSDFKNGKLEGNAQINHSLY